MQILRWMNMLLISCSVFDLYKRFLDYVGFVFMETLTCVDVLLNYLGSSCNFGYVVLILGSFKPILELFGMFLLLGFGLKVLSFSWYCKGFGRFVCDFGGKYNLLDVVFCARDDFAKKWDWTISSGKCEVTTFVKNLSLSPNGKLETPDFESSTHNKTRIFHKEDCENDNCADIRDQEQFDEDLEFDVQTLRKMVQMERHRANAACLELEKERMASATAAEETMAMILRLQNEKSLIEMEANQYQRLAQEKQLHDQEVIHSLQWLVLKHESEKAILEDQLKLYQQRLNLFVEDEEGQHSDKAEKYMTPLQAISSTEHITFDTSLWSSLDLDLSLVE